VPLIQKVAEALGRQRQERSKEQYQPTCSNCSCCCGAL